MSKRQRAVMPETLESPERDLEVQSAEDGLELALREVVPAPTDSELVARIQALRGALPDSQGVACRACFQRGAKAVLAAVDTERPDVREQITALWTTYPRDDAPHQAASYRAGVEAALQAIAE